LDEPAASILVGYFFHFTVQDYSSAPKMEAVDYPETSANFYHITGRHIPDYGQRRSDQSDSLKSHMFFYNLRTFLLVVLVFSWVGIW
jgi:hypothetical protein